VTEQCETTADLWRSVDHNAPAEQIFSAKGQILNQHHSRLSDDHFEMMMLLKVTVVGCLEEKYFVRKQFIIALVV